MSHGRLSIVLRIVGVCYGMNFGVSVRVVVGVDVGMGVGVSVEVYPYGSDSAPHLHIISISEKGK